MTKTEIIDEISKLNPDDRREIWDRLGEMDQFIDEEDDDDLTPEQWELVKTRMEDDERNPESAITWKELEARLNKRRRS